HALRTPKFPLRLVEELRATLDKQGENGVPWQQVQEVLERARDEKHDGEAGEAAHAIELFGSVSTALERAHTRGAIADYAFWRQVIDSTIAFLSWALRVRPAPGTKEDPAIE